MVFLSTARPTVRTTKTGVALIGLCVVTACTGPSPSGDQPPAGSSNEPAATASALFGTDVVARCAGFDAEAAAAFLGGTDVVDQSGEGSPDFRICTFVRQGDPARSVSFSLSREDTAQAAATGFAQLRDNISLAANLQQSGEASPGDSPLIEISGLGDEALWTDVNRALTVRRGNLTILVMQPPERRDQVAVAEKVLSLLR